MKEKINNVEREITNVICFVILKKKYKTNIRLIYKKLRKNLPFSLSSMMTKSNTASNLIKLSP